MRCLQSINIFPARAGHEGRCDMHPDIEAAVHIKFTRVNPDKNLMHDVYLCSQCRQKFVNELKY